MRLIDADELKRAIEDRIDYVPSNDYDEGWNSAINTAIDEIDNAPTVEERPQGKWILCEDSFFSKCSICGDIGLNEECNNYCPNCGAYMRSDNDDKK